MNAFVRLRDGSRMGTAAGKAMLAVVALGWAVQAAAQETTTYIYDAKGRVTSVSHSGGPINGTTSSYTYDSADNRTNLTVAGSPNGSGSGSGGGASQVTTYSVVLLGSSYTTITYTR